MLTCVPLQPAAPSAVRPLNRKGSNLFTWLETSFGPARELNGSDEGFVRKSPLGTLSAVRTELLKSDPSLNQSLISSGTSISQLFDQDKWERHRHINRYWRNLTQMLGSTVFARVLLPVLALTAHAALVALLGLSAPAIMFPVQLLGTAVGLLLVFRTNQSYARFSEGRQAWGQLVATSRDVARLASCYMRRETRAKVCALLVVHALLLKAHLRQGRTRENADDPTAYKDRPEEAVRRTLKEALDETEADRLADKLLSASNKPYACALEISRSLRQSEIGKDVPSEVRWCVLLHADALGRVCGVCERLLSTPIPLSYTRHTGRALLLWLLAANHAMASSLGLLTPVLTFVLAFTLVGIDEIGMQLEEPFGVLPLQPLCEVIADDISFAEQWAADVDTEEDRAPSHSDQQADLARGEAPADVAHVVE